MSPFLPHKKRRAAQRKKAAMAQKEEGVEDAAKKSFQVRRSHLMEIAGHSHTANKNHRQQKRNKMKADMGTTSSPCDEQHNNCNQSSIVGKLISAIKVLLSYVLYIISLGYFQSNYIKAGDGDTPSNNKQRAAPTSEPPNLTQEPSSNSTSEDYYSNVTIVGLDCEMVGGGRGGWKSLLARCSVVTLDIKDDDVDAPTTNAKANTTTTQAKVQKLSSLDENLVVLYDKYIIPKGGVGKITDYRTEWSGITKDTYKLADPSNCSGPDTRWSGDGIPIVSFHKCQNEITQLFSSINGKRVIVVGHALENDFEALEIEHPLSLTRDTAFYKPYMRQVRRKMYSRKLSTLSSEILDIEIQQKQQQQKATTAIDNDKNGKSITNASNVGHSSVEDAAAALRLYWHSASNWERSLGHPLIKTQQHQRIWPPLKCMYLDGCNLPLGIRGVNLNDLMKNNDDASTTTATIIPANTLRLTSRKRENNQPSNISTIDWIPIFQSALSSSSTPKIQCISVMFDGAKFSNFSNVSDGFTNNTEDTFDTRIFCLENSSSSSTKEDQSLKIEVTKIGESADDVLFHRCCTVDVAMGTNTTANSTNPAPPSRRVITLNQVIEILSSDNDGVSDALPCYIVIRRKAGGSKTHRRLFDKLHLRRPNEGALCLSGITPGLQKNSLRIARELQRERSVERVIECELRDRDELKQLVVTDDVYLTDRLVRNGVLVLSYKQLSCLW